VVGNGDPRAFPAEGIVLTGAGLSLREAFWQRLVSEAGPLGALGPQQLAELRSLLHLALADTHQQADGHPERPAVRGPQRS